MELIEGQVFMSVETRKLAMEEYNQEVKILFNNTRRKLGDCHKYHKRDSVDGALKDTFFDITYSNRYIEKLNKEQLMSLIIHEVSHIKYPNHKQIFKNECNRIAKKLEFVFNDNYNKLELNQYNYIYECGCCGYKMGRVRPIKKIVYHAACYDKLKEKGEICIEEAKFKTI